MGVKPEHLIDMMERPESDPHLSTVRRYAMAVGALIAHDVIPEAVAEPEARSQTPAGDVILISPAPDARAASSSACVVTTVVMSSHPADALEADSALVVIAFSLSLGVGGCWRRAGRGSSGQGVPVVAAPSGGR